MYAKIIVDISHANVDRVFDYRIPAGMAIATGMRVVVPFGRKELEGFVIGVANDTAYDEGKIKDIKKPLEGFGAFTEEQLTLAEHMRRTYKTTLAQALRLMIPAQLRGGRVAEKKQKFCFLRQDGEALARAREALYKKDGTPKYPRQIEVLERLGGAAAGLPVTDFSASAVQSLEKKGIVRVQKAEVSRLPFDARVPLIGDFELTQAQRDVLDVIRAAKHGKRFLLRGVTGSGKTEVYIRVIRDCVAQGKTAIMLVPEISLTPQTYLFLKQRLTEDIAVFHSGLSAGERFDEWKKVKTGRARVVLGARSAVFAPVENIGAIIIDEQHEGSYKSDNYPKYTAADIARERCARNGAVLLMGSATPDIETYYEAGQGAYTLLKMPERLFGLQLPEVTVVDMREEMRKGNRGVISGELYGRLDRALADGKQAMLFLNRRGYATFVMCRACGYTVQCGACDITLTYHKTQNHLRCHYCGRTEPVRKMCPTCGKPYLKYFGTGTQQVEEQIKALFPDARVMRMDMDTMGTKDAHLKAFETFSAGEADILIGTQMITKGFDFEHVAVSAVLAADTMLNLPDYRSAEYTFSQITQIAGRAGRKNPGSVVLQTYNPEHYAIRYAKRHDYEGFYRHEAALRKIAQLPPFAVFVQIQFAGEREEMVIRSVKDFLARLKTVLLPRKDGIISIKASESLIKRINHKERYHIMIKLRKQDADIADEVYRLFVDVQYRDVLMGIDINPVGMG